MSNVVDLPESGYSILKVYAGEQVIRPRVPDDDKGEKGTASFGWDWRRLPVEREFEVVLSLVIHPNQQRPEYVRVSTVGRFEIVGDTPSVSFDDFVAQQAVAILLPYARQFISGLTANSVFGCFYLPTINVAKLMAGVDRSKATGAADGSARGSESN